MADPIRWRDQDGSAPSEIRELLSRSPKTRPMTQSERSRAASRVARVTAIPLTVGALVSAKSIAASAAVGAAGAVAVLGGIAVWPSTPSTLPSAVETPSTVVVAPAKTSAPTPSPASLDRTDPAPEAPIVEEAAPAPSPQAAPLRKQSDGSDKEVPSAPQADTKTESAEALLREASLLEQARADLATNPGQALARLDAHRAEFPSGQLALEREFLTIDALRRTGRAAEARARGEALLERSTVYRDRVRRILDSLP